MKLRVALIGTSWKLIPPNGYGGIENVIFDLITGSKELDIDFTLFSVRETLEAGKIPKNVPIHWFFESEMYSEIANEQTKMWIEASHAMAAWEMVRKHDFDLIHDHSGIGFAMIAGSVPLRPPVLMTLHGPLEQNFFQYYYRFLNEKPGIFFNSISYAQRKPMPDLNYAGNVYNGLNFENVPFSNEKKNYIFIIGRITPCKGQKEAISVAKELGINLVIAGKVETNYEGMEYWEKEIEPRIDVKINETSNIFEHLEYELSKDLPQIIYFGEADTRQKFHLYKYAKASLMPISWEEPFGLVMIESMATGTPVVGFRRGSVPEIISHGENGYIVENIEEMISAIEHISVLSPEMCRKSVVKRFSSLVMARSYDEIYRKILKQHALVQKSGI